MEKLKKLPGILICIFIAWLGSFLAQGLGSFFGFQKSPFSPIILAILLGILLRNTYFPSLFSTGVQFSIKFILRLGIILLGIRLSLGDILQLGVLGAPLVLVCIVTAILCTFFFAGKIGISSKMGCLIAVGSSICGATAIVATAPMIKAKQEEITYAVANITIFGVLVMLLYPYFSHFVFASSETMVGLFLGTSIHETAQVAGAGLIYGQLYENEAVLNIATTTKLIRNTFMALVIPILAYIYHKNEKSKAEKFDFTQALPLFILGFVFFAFLRTVGDFSLQYKDAAFGIWTNSNWELIVKTIKHLAEVFLTIAMAGVGLNTSIKQLAGLGMKPFYVGLIAAMSVGIASFIGIFTIRFLGLI
jgi:uncharacterized integral membrane protein (TIGR00698 family)